MIYMYSLDRFHSSRDTLQLNLFFFGTKMA